LNGPLEGLTTLIGLNVKLNGVRPLVHVINGDAKSIIESSLVEEVYLL